MINIATHHNKLKCGVCLHTHTIQCATGDVMKFSIEDISGIIIYVQFLNISSLLHVLQLAPTNIVVQFKISIIAELSDSEKK